tara:strand:+ start:7729 stop:8811 length:1083 start_codon:yes stop_codon:yes gene_type:complete
MLIDIIAGTRPNFVKVSSLIHALNDRSYGLNYRLIHTGQHYNDELSKIFFKQLKIPKPHINLNVGSGSQADQVGSIMSKYEKVLFKKKPDLCVVVGDVNSTMACAITAKKMNIKVAHIEAGIRSNDISMPEEINRMVTDSITDYFFTTSKIASKNLYKLGANKENVFFVGNTMIDTLLSNSNNLIKPDFYDIYDLKKEYFVLTLHRPSNVDNISVFKNIIDEIMRSTGNLKVIFPVHPRTQKNIQSIKNISDRLICVNSLPYLEFNYLVKNSIGVITDSGGITEEATMFRVPCITMRNTTERPETVENGTNVLIGSNLENLPKYVRKIISNKWKKSSFPEKWDGKTGPRIIKIICQVLNN